MGSSMNSGMDLSLVKRLKSGVGSTTAGKTSLDTNGTDKISIPFQHPGLSTGLDVSNFSDPTGIGGQNISLGKSLPIHCVIEVITNLTTRGDRGSDENAKNEQFFEVSESSILDASGNGRSSPEKGSSNKVVDGGKIVEVDDFVIIPAGTAFQDVVATVLTLLGYPKDTIQQAVGMVYLKNWKPLRLDQVCDSPLKTVGDIFNDLTNHATLRVLVTRSKEGTAESLNDKLLRLLLAQSSSLMLGSGCPLDEVTLGQLTKGQWPQNLADDVKRRFNQWCANHFLQRFGSLESLQQSPQLQPPLDSGNLSYHQIGSASSRSSREDGGLSSPLASHHHHRSHLVNGANGRSTLSSVAAAAEEEEDHFNHLGRGLVTQKTRMRTSFDPEHELPKLQQWFADNPHPTRHQIQQYVRELNCLDCRRDRKPLDINNVIYWFKNARAAAKRNESRYNGLAVFPHALHYHHYHSQIPAVQQTHNHVNSPSGGDDSRDDEQHFHHHHSHHRNQVPRSRSLDSDEPENSRVGENESEFEQLTDNIHRNESGWDLFSVENKQESDKTGKQGVSSLSPSSCVKRDLYEKQKTASAGSPSLVNLNQENLSQDSDNEKMKYLRVKEVKDEDGISMDAELTEGSNLNTCSPNPADCCNNNQPKDLNGKSRSDYEGNGDPVSVVQQDKRHYIVEKRNEDGIEGEKKADFKNRIESYSKHQSHHHQHTDIDDHSISPSMSPGSSPRLSPNHNFDISGVGRFQNLIEHPIMAYRHFNAFKFGQRFDNSNGDDTQSHDNGGQNGYETAPTMVSACNEKGMLVHGKPSPGFDMFPYGIPIISGTEGGRGHITELKGERSDPLARFRGDELCSSRPVSSADIISSIINSTGADLGINPLNLGAQHPNQNCFSLDERKKRNRTFIDPVTEVPRLENWFLRNTHPSHQLILKYTEELNRMPYRQKFPQLEPKNVQFWFKNRRAKCKRLKMTL